jgi:glycerol-3-phosphate cytidylyltransferase
MLWNRKKKVVGFTCGAFDLLHAGHILMLQECKLYCDVLIVGVQEDPSLDRPQKNAPVMTYTERLTMIRAIRCVDEIVPYGTEAELYEILKMMPIDIRILGIDWKGKEFTGHDLSLEVVFNTRDHGYSTSSLRKRVYDAEVKIRNDSFPEDAK